MTIAALLRHHGVSVPRYVTVDGQIVFDHVTASDAGKYSHATLGAVTPIPNHTFHGGADVPDSQEVSSAPWWDDEVQINRHINAMANSFPKFVYFAAEPELSPCWIGTIDTGRGSFQVAIILRRDRGLPGVAILSGGKLGAPAGRRWQRAPHLYDSGNLCVASQEDWNPEEHTVAAVAAWTSHWMAAYTEWRMTRRWPVEGVQVIAA